MKKTTKKAADTVSLKQLREQFPYYIDAVSKGKSFTVMKRSKPVFRIGPVSDDGDWDTIADFTSIDKRGVAADEILEQL